jgi:hypothetical protein
MKLVGISDAKAARRADDAQAIRDLADRIERGDVRDFVVVANNLKDGVFISIGDFEDRWRILGALEYAKSTVNGN